MIISSLHTNNFWQKKSSDLWVVLSRRRKEGKKSKDKEKLSRHQSGNISYKGLCVSKKKKIVGN